MTNPDFGAILATLKAEAASTRELMDVKFNDILDRHDRQERSVEQANRFAAEGIERLHTGQSEMKAEMKVDRDERRGDIAVLRSAMNLRMQGLEDRLVVVEGRQRDSDTAQRTRTAFLARWLTFPRLIAATAITAVVGELVVQAAK